MSSQTESFCTGQGALDASSPSGIRRTKAENVVKSDIIIVRRETALQVSRLTLNVTCPDDTSLQIIQKLNAFMSETGQQPESFRDRIIFASMFNDNTCWESPKVQQTCPVQPKEVAIHAARFRLGCWCLCGPESEKTSTYSEQRPSHQFADGEWNKLDLRMTSELIH